VGAGIPAISGEVVGGEVRVGVVGRRLTTPHKLRPEARSRKRARRRRGVPDLRKPTAEAVTFHAVVR
jgi:hypothetical protein